MLPKRVHDTGNGPCQQMDIPCMVGNSRTFNKDSLQHDFLLYIAQGKPMSVHWLWWEQSLTRLNSAFVNTLSAVQSTFIKSIRISHLFIDEVLKHLQVSFLQCLSGESSCSHFEKKSLAISCEALCHFGTLQHCTKLFS